MHGGGGGGVMVVLRRLRPARQPGLTSVTTPLWAWTVRVVGGRQTDCRLAFECT
jgi:hypothetical protein